MFDMMLPSSSLKLHLSKMNMFGIGNRMMRRIMKRKGIDSLETLRRQAIDNGVEFIACQMSMVPSSSLKLHLSKMNMFGIGNRMMRRIMKRKGIDSLETLRRQAIDNGVEFIACQMSMEVMGVQREELLDNVTVGGVATYMERAGKANVNLFI